MENVIKKNDEETREIWNELRKLRTKIIDAAVWNIKDGSELQYDLIGDVMVVARNESGKVRCTLNDTEMRKIELQYPYGCEMRGIESAVTETLKYGDNRDWEKAVQGFKETFRNEAETIKADNVADRLDEGYQYFLAEFPHHSNTGINITYEVDDNGKETLSFFEEIGKYEYRDLAAPGTIREDLLKWCREGYAKLYEEMDVLAEEERQRRLEEERQRRLEEEVYETPMSDKYCLLIP